jgi:hypothetical protein
MVGLTLFACCSTELIECDIGTNYIGGTGETQSDAAWLVPLCLQLFPAVILFVGMIFMVTFNVNTSLGHSLTP